MTQPPATNATPPTDADEAPLGTVRVETRAEDGRLLSVAHLNADGAMHGPFIAFAPDGRVQMRMGYRDGQPDGPAVIYRDGRLQTELCYAAGELEGELRGYDLAGRLASIVRYAQGRKHGLTECFSPDGRPLVSMAYDRDRQHGPTTEHHPDGSVRRRTPYVDGLPDGESLEFHPGGAPAARTLYRAGVVVDGPTRFDDPAGPGKTSLLGRLFGK